MAALVSLPLDKIAGNVIQVERSIKMLGNKSASTPWKHRDVLPNESDLLLGGAIACVRVEHMIILYT